MEPISDIFVYGTLMQGFSNSEKYLSGFAINRKPGQMKGDLFHLIYGFPAATEGKGRVVGEIVRVKDINKILWVLDWLEDCDQPDPMYQRVVREARDYDGNITKCYVYLGILGAVMS